LIVSAWGRILSPYLNNPGGRVPAKNVTAAGVPLFKDAHRKSSGNPSRGSGAANKTITSRGRPKGAPSTAAKEKIYKKKGIIGGKLYNEGNSPLKEGFK
jgi:hypothetical protein